MIVLLGKYTDLGYRKSIESRYQSGTKIITQEIPPEKKCEKNCLFSQEFRDGSLLVGARSELMPIFKLKMRARGAFSA